MAINIRPEIESISEEIIATRQDFHKYPELAFNEHRSAKIIAEKLILSGTKHFDFSDTPQFSPASRKFGISGSMEMDKLRNLLNTRIISFFEEYL